MKTTKHNCDKCGAVVREDAHRELLIDGVMVGHKNGRLIVWCFECNKPPAKQKIGGRVR